MIRGGDGNAGFAVRHPNGQLVKAYEWLPSSDYSEPAAAEGYYAVCLDNQFSRFASKLVNIYMTVIKYDEWQKYAQEIEGLQLNIQNFTVRISHIVYYLYWEWDQRIWSEKKIFVLLFCFSRALVWWNVISMVCYNSKHIHVAQRLETMLCSSTTINMYSIGHLPRLPLLWLHVPFRYVTKWRLCQNG